MRDNKTVGILGGMGPYATLSFYETLLKLTPANRDWDHLRVIMDVNTQIPSRSRHHLYGESSPVPAMIDSCRRLEAYPVDFIVIPCNSACHYLPELRPAVRIPILNIMQATVASLARQMSGNRRVAVFGGVITWERRTYEPFLEAAGMTYVHHPPTVQRRAEHLIERLKLNVSGERVLEDFHALVRTLRNDHGADAVVLGCTEFGCLGDVAADLPLFDSSRELAQATVSLALGGP